MSCERCASGCSAQCCSCDCACADDRLENPGGTAGQSTLPVRLGDYGRFFLHGVRRLSDSERPALNGLGTRSSDDPTIAWLDAWAVAADVLTFYRERLTNEGYLRTALDGRALREIAALVGFRPRPGVAATAHLAYTLDKSAAPVTIPAGAKAQTIPAPGEQMQTFETDAPLDARFEWNLLVPRLWKTPVIDIYDAVLRETLSLSDIAAPVRVGDRILLLCGASRLRQVVREISSVRIDALGGRLILSLKRKGITRDDLKAALTAVGGAGRLSAAAKKKIAEAEQVLLGGSAVSDFRLEDDGDGKAQVTSPQSLFERLSKSAPRQLGASSELVRDVARSLDTTSEGALRLARSLVRGLDDRFYSTWSKVNVSGTRSALQAAYLLRVSATAYGSSAPWPAKAFRENEDTPDPNRDWLLTDTDKAADSMYLDATYDTVTAGDYIVYDAPLLADEDGHAIPGANTWRLARTKAADVVSRSDYMLPLRVTRVRAERLFDDTRSLWDFKRDDARARLGWMRPVTVLTGSEKLPIAPDEITDDVFGDTIVLNDLYPEIDSGRWIIVAGERTDIRDANDRAVPGIQGGELAMVSHVTQGPDQMIPGDTPHTTVYLVSELAYRYKRATVKIYGNVTKASHGETVSEVLGSGDATSPRQRFALKRPPLTFTTAPVTAGVVSSESVRVNDMLYWQVDSLLDAGADQHAYELDLDEQGAAAVTFGDGINGARLPTGAQNVRALYRVGIGSAGNALAEQISLLTTRPLGVTAVLNPLRAAGGADADGPERIRKNTPMAALALSPLSRLVSEQDYAYFARRFAGIGDASAVRLSDGMQEIMHVTLAGVDDIPLTADSDLVASIRAAFLEFGDPAFPVVVAIRELKALAVQASIEIDADRSWDAVQAQIRRRLVWTFGFENRRLAQPVYLSEVSTVIQRTPGVVAVDIDLFGGIVETAILNADALKQAVAALGANPPAFVGSLAARANPDRDLPRNEGAPAPARTLPAQMVCVLPAVPDLLVLNRRGGGNVLRR